MKRIILIMIVLIIFLMIPNIKFGFNLIDSKKQSYQEIKLAGEWIKENSNPEDIIIGGSLPQLSYYSERSIYPFHLSYRRDIEKIEESDLDKFILENHPKYFSISVYEKEKSWAFTYPQKHQDFMIPVQTYGPSNNQPVLVVYRFDYEKMKSL